MALVTPIKISYLLSSLGFEITKKTTLESNINEVLLKEINNKIYDKITYKNYKLNCIKYKNNLI